MICGTCDRANGICRFVSQDRAISKIAAVREAVGSEVGIGVDFHGRVHKTMPKILAKELEPFHPMFIEEPCCPKTTKCFEKYPNTFRYLLLRAKGCFRNGSLRICLRKGM